MKNLILFPLILLVIICKGQERKKILALTYGIGSGSEINFAKGSPSIGIVSDDRSLSMFGVNYLYQGGDKLFIETGLNYSNYGRKSKYGKTNSYDANLINLLFKLRHTYGKYFFLNYGISIDLGIGTIENNSYSGLGANFGLGWQYYFKNNMGVFFNPHLNLHRLISPETSSYSEPTFDSNLTLGVTYTLKKLSPLNNKSPL